ncbi:MAG: sigma 54-interacting transcriptional regulator, partial [Syntrophobacteraceae bacterium]
MEEESKKAGVSDGQHTRSGKEPTAGEGDDQATMIYGASAGGKDETVAVQPTLEVVSGSANKTVLPLGREKVTLGRVGFNDLVLNDKKVSRTHAAIYFEKGHYVVEDLNSTNGVTVDGNLVKKIVLKSGNRIGLGDCVLLFTQDVPEISLENQIDFINRSDLFNWLDEETRGLLARSLSLRFFPKNATVIRQNTPAESMFFLYSGTARVVELNEEGGERVIDQLGAGDSFGESALLAGESGKYSVVSNTDLNVLELKREQLNELLQKKPELFKAFYRMVLKKFSAAQAKPEAVDPRIESLRHVIVSTDVQIVGEDKKIKEAVKKIDAFARENKTVLITGPSGTGKKNLARYYHKVSAHPEYPYVEISVAELEEGKVGPAIFGVEADPEATHMKGRIGYLEMIGTGTLAIGHVEQLDAHQQSKLATYIRYGWFHRVYGRESVKSKTTVVLIATGTEAEVMEKLIPELRDMLQGQAVTLPPLVQRLKDIPLLAEYYLQTFAKKNGKRISGLSREATERLVSYTWPGNVKELENVIQRAAIVTSEDVIIPGDLIFVIPSEKEIHKLNILKTDKVRGFFRHPLFPSILTWVNIAVVVLMAGFTLYGGSRPADHPLQDFGNNPGMLITWLVWFPILPISAFLIGRIWCGMCPIAGIGALAAKVKSFNLPVPKILKRMDFWMVVLAFLFLDWVEELFSVASKPWATGMLLVIIISTSALFCVLFERKTFCRYVCPLAGMLGAYSTMSIVEVRGNKKVCQTQCGQHACYKGSDHAPGCPMFSYPASLGTNCECMMCFNCLKSCENRGVQLNLRPPLQELWRQA